MKITPPNVFFYSLIPPFSKHAILYLFLSPLQTKRDFNDDEHMELDPLTKVWKCKHCDHTSKWKGGLKRHVEARHMQLDKYKCRFCGKTFRWSSTSIYHASKCTKNTFNIVVTRNYFDDDEEEGGGGGNGGGAQGGSGGGSANKSRKNKKPSKVTILN